MDGSRRAASQTPPLTLRATDAAPPDRTRLATLSLHVSGAFCLLAGTLLVLLALSGARDVAGHALPGSTAWWLGAACLGLAVCLRQLIRALRRNRGWAWTAAVVWFAIQLPSVALPLGALGLFGLLSEGTRARFRAARDERADTTGQ